VTFPEVGEKTLYLTRSKEYLYDVHDQLIAAEEYGAYGEGGTLTRAQQFVYERGHCVVEFDDSGSGSVAYRLYGPGVDMPLAVEHVVPAADPDPVIRHVIWTLTDHQGTVRTLACDEGETLDVWQVKYTPFGVPALTGGLPALVNTFYAGRDLDRFTGLYNNRARWYDAGAGRFLSEDPIGFAAGDANLYRYCGNSPTNFTDPSGQSWEDLLFGGLQFVGGFLQAAAGVTMVGAGLAGELPSGGTSSVLVWLGGFATFKGLDNMQAGLWRMFGDSESQTLTHKIVSGVSGGNEQLAFAVDVGTDLLTLNPWTSLPKSVPIAAPKLARVAPKVAQTFGLVPKWGTHVPRTLPAWHLADLGTVPGRLLQNLGRAGSLTTAGGKMANYVFAGSGSPDDGEETPSVKGGPYENVRRGNIGGQVHHAPAASVSPYSRVKGPSVWMETADHMRTASWGSLRDARAFRQQQADLIAQGRLREAIQIDINDIRSKFGTKYDEHIRQMLNAFGFSE